MGYNKDIRHSYRGHFPFQYLIDKSLDEMEIILLVNKLRDKFLESYGHKTGLFDYHDFQRIIKNDFTIHRYLLHHSMDESKAYEMFIESMKWRKEFGVNCLKDNDFPKLFYSCGAVFPYCPDKNGFKTLFIRIKMIKKIPEFKNHYKRFLVHNINKIDLETMGRGWVLVVDASGAGLANCDVDMLIFLISTLNNNFPAAIQYVLLHSMPFVLTSVWKVAKTFIPSESLDMIRFSTSRDITKYIPIDSLPDFLMGNSKRDYNEVPVDSPEVLDFGTSILELPIDRVIEIIDSFDKFLSKHK